MCAAAGDGKSRRRAVSWRGRIARSGAGWCRLAGGGRPPGPRGEGRGGGRKSGGRAGRAGADWRGGERPGSQAVRRGGERKYWTPGVGVVKLVHHVVVA